MNSADAEESRAKSDRRLGLSLLAFCALVTCASVASLACPKALPAANHDAGARCDTHDASGSPLQLAFAHGSARLDPRDAALPDCELRAVEPEDSEQDASLGSPAVRPAGGAAWLPSADADIVPLGCTAWARQHVASAALARAPPRVSRHVGPNLADTRPASVYGRSAALAS